MSADVERMSDAEAEVWEEFWETDAARCCSCPSCNHYALDYEQHKGEPCLLQTLIERIIAARATQPAPEAGGAEGEAGLRPRIDKAVRRFENRSGGDLGAATVRLHGDLLAALAADTTTARPT